MRPALRRDLGYASILQSEFFAKQGTLFVESVILCRESYSRIDAVGGPSTCVHDGIMGQCNRMKYRRRKRSLASPWEDQSAVAEDWRPS